MRAVTRPRACLTRLHAAFASSVRVHKFCMLISRAPNERPGWVRNAHATLLSPQNRDTPAAALFPPSRARDAGRT